MGAASQAGVFSGLNPASFNSGDPLVLFVIQVTIIIAFCRIIAIPLTFFKQPKVISEVIAGIILGPTVMGRIPGFQNTIFPTASLPFINLIATLGLVFFLFQVGLEVHVEVIRRDWHRSVSVAFAGMALPFGLGAAVSVGLYKLQNDPSIPFSSFLLFLGVAMSITAFPVLARILVELNLLRTRVGAITMAAGLINDCTAWVLLALVVALLNASGGIHALYVLLTAIGFSLFLIFIVRPLYRKLCVYTNSFENGPSHLLMTVTLMIVLLSAFVTDIIGVHAIFGGFLAGVIIPHENDLSIKITEKIEDLVNIIFLPLYFTLSGLKTQIGLLNTGEVWGYVILVIFLACFGKIVGCTVAARFTGLTNRESLTVGFLMNCKGLVELIVLNLGHDAGVLNDQVFVIMVVMALVTTFITTPVVDYLYPEWYQKQTNAHMHDTDDSSDLDKLDKEGSSIKVSTVAAVGLERYCIVALLNRMESVPSLMSIIQLLKRDRIVNSVEIHALRLIELSDRTSDVMKVKDVQESKRQDPVLNVLRTFARLSGIQSLQTHVDFTTDYIKTVSSYGEDVHANLVLLPSVTKHEEVDLDFVQAAFTIQHTNVGVLIDRGFGQTQDGDLDITPQIIVAYQGNPDDRAALLFALKLQAYTKINVTVVTTRFSQESDLYASNGAVQQYIQDDTVLSLQSLFSSSNGASNIVCQQVDSLTSDTVLSSLKRPLSKSDLVILGRNAVVDQGAESDHEKALGPLGFSILKNSKNTSILIVRSVTLSL